MRNTISAKYIREYLTETYGEVRQEPKKFAKAIRLTASDFDLNKKDLFHFVVDQKPTIPMALSYGFQTGYGRELMNRVQDYYYN